jgi:hypothetical protein
MEDGVRCELVKLHTINKKKPTKKLVGRERKSVEEEGKEHHPITARGLRDLLGARELDGVAAGDEAVRPGLLHLLLHDDRGHPASRGGCCLSLSHGVLGRKVLTRIYQSAPGGYAREEKEAEIDNGGGGGEKELVNSTNPHYPFIYLLGEGTWAETW